MISENTSTPSFSCFILDATVPYALATLQAPPHGERKGLRKKAKQWSVVTPISIMHRKAHISQGFKQGLQIGCEGSQMTSRPQFPPCWHREIVVNSLGVTSPFETLLAMDPHPPKMHIPTNFCIQFQGVWGFPTPIQGSWVPKKSMDWAMAVFLQIRKFYK